MQMKNVLLTLSTSLWHMYIVYALLCSTQGVMKDRWMNIGFEDDELKPYMEPKPDLNDQARIRECATYTYIYVACWCCTCSARVCTCT